MGAMAGTLGLLLATPLIASLIPITRMLYVEDVLGDHNAETEEEPLGKRRRVGGRRTRAAARPAPVTERS
jgi:hypothetical protein